MGFEPDMRPSGGGGEAVGLDNQQRIVRIAADHGGHLDYFAYQFAHRADSCEKGGAPTGPRPLASGTV